MTLISQIDKTQLHSCDSFESVIKLVDEVEVKRSISLDQVSDTERGLKDIADRMYPYRQLSDYFTGVYQCYRKLSRVCPQVGITLTELQSLLSDILTQRDNTKFFLSQSSLPPFLLHLEHTLTLKIHKDMLSSLFPHQRLLFPLLLALTSFKSNTKGDVWNLLKYHHTVPVLDGLEQLHMHDQSDQVQYQIHLKRMIWERSTAFKHVTNSLENNSNQWDEYFKVRVHAN